MAVYSVSPARSAPAGLTRPVELVCLALATAHAVYLIASYVAGTWLVAPDGSFVPSDFVNVFAAGHLARDGHAAAAYDWPAHKLVEEQLIGHSFGGYFGWHYPPPFLFIAAPLSLLPYPVGYALWVAVTFPLYAIAARAMVGETAGYLLAAAFPAILANFIVGQNGFLTAALFGGGLLLVDRRPLVAGVLFGLLTYKPHLGLLISVALIAGGYWRVITAAAVTAAIMAASSYAVFGADTWQGFFGSIGHTSQAFLSEGRADFGKLQTAFGLTRSLGFSETAAWTVQALIAVAAAAAVAVIWRGRAAPELKAAILGVGAMLATPYLYTYDLVALAVPLAFLYRFGRTRGSLPYEFAGIGLCWLLILIFPFVKAPTGFAAVVVTAALVASRIIAERRIAGAITS